MYEDYYNTNNTKTKKKRKQQIKLYEENKLSLINKTNNELKSINVEFDKFIELNKVIISNKKLINIINDLHNNNGINTEYILNMLNKLPNTTIEHTRTTGSHIIIKLSILFLNKLNDNDVKILIPIVLVENHRQYIPFYIIKEVKNILNTYYEY